MKLSPSRRLIVATAAAIACQLMLTFLVSRLPGIERTSLRTALGWLQPVSYAVVALSMALGGWLGGRRFVLIAAVLTLLVWLGTLYGLAQAVAPMTGKPLLSNLLDGLDYNKLGIVCSLLAAAAGAALGSLRPLAGTPR